MIGWKEGYTKGVIGPIFLLLLFGLKWAGMARKAGEKEWQEGVKKGRTGGEKG